MLRHRVAAYVIATLIAAGCASTPPPASPEIVGLTGLPARITINEWPFWVDIPIQSKDFDRVWRTVVDIVSERAAISVLDKESGYLRTEWRPVDATQTLLFTLTPADRRTGRGATVDSTVIGDSGEQRYTFRIRAAESKIRMGIEARLMPSQRWASGLRNIPNTPWVGIHREMQDRLVVR